MESSTISYFSTAKSMISSLFGIVLWASRLPFPMQSPKEFPTHQYLQLGLKTLIFPQPAYKNPPTQDHHQHHPHIVQRFMVSPSSSSSQASSSQSQPSCMLLENTSSWSSSAMDDLIGTDSGVPLMLSEEQNKWWVENTAGASTLSLSRIKRSGTDQIRDRRKTEYPPPIPLLAQTGNLTCRMPWTLTRHCCSDGRLVLKGAKVKHHEYFDVRRENGRLVLNLVPLDGTMTCRFEDNVVPEENEGGELEMEADLQLVEEDDDDGNNPVEQVDDDADENDDDDNNDDDDKNVDKNETAVSGYKSVPQSHLEIPRCKRYGNLSKDFKSEGGLVDLDSSSVSFGDKTGQNIHNDTNTNFVHPASAPPRPLMVSVM